MASFTREHNLKASVFKDVCYRSDLDGTIWWSNGHLMVQEKHLTKRTLKTITNYYVKTSFTADMRQVLSEFQPSKAIEVIHKPGKIASFQRDNFNKRSGLFCIFENNVANIYVCIQHNYMLTNKLYTDGQQNTALYNSLHEPSFIVMPFNVDKKEILTILQELRKTEIQSSLTSDRRFINILKEDMYE